MTYNKSPGNPVVKRDKRTYPTRTRVTSTPKYSAMPPHTPAIILSFDLYNFFSIGFIQLKRGAKLRKKIIQ